MAFDKDSDKPIIQPKKPDTKINLWMAVLIIVFFALGAFALLRVAKDPPDSREEATDVTVP
mgnify:CR=1 FL=1